MHSQSITKDQDIQVRTSRITVENKCLVDSRDVIFQLVNPLLMLCPIVHTQYHNLRCAWIHVYTWVTTILSNRLTFSTKLSKVAHFAYKNHSNRYVAL